MSSKATAIAVFDISSSSVGGAHALIERDSNDENKNAVTLLVQERRDSGLEEEINIERFIEDTAKALEVVIHHVRTADVHHPSAIQVVLSSPWYNAYTRTIVYKKDATFTCTKRLVDSLIEKEVAALLQQPSTIGEAFGRYFKVAEQHIAQVTLNGYPTSDPYGKKALSMEIILNVTLIPDVVADRFTSILRRSYGNRPIHVTTGPHAAFVALRDNGDIAADSVIIDVGEEVTDVAFVKNNLFLAQHSFPVGSYELYRVLSDRTGSTIEARALVEAYRLKKLSPGSSRTVEKALHAFAATWQKAFHQIVDQGQTGFRFPTHCYVVADHRFETVFTPLLASDPFLLHSTAASSIQATFVDADHFSASIKTSTADHVDTSLAIGALFMERLL
jgi:hypothetical protein